MTDTVDATVGEVDLTDAELYRHGFPHDVFVDLRHRDPVHWQAFPEEFPGRNDGGFWVLSRHEDIQRVSRDDESFDAWDGPMLGLRPELRGTMLVSMDGRDHLRLRRLINAGFTPRMVRRLDERTRAWAVSIVDRALEKGTCDFVPDVAFQLPMQMIADIVGIPLEDRTWLFGVTNDLLLGTDSLHPVTPERQLDLQVELFEYAHQLGERKRAEPMDDVWTVLSTIEVEDDDGVPTQLSKIELDMFFLLLVIAGSETTRNALAGGLLALAAHPGQLAALRPDPELVPAAVDEVLRWSSPVTCFARRATHDVEIRDVPVAAGDRVSLWYPSGNRDEDVFPDPFRFDIRRNPNPHVAFGGGGPHFCLGANLARREILILLQELLARTRDIEVLGPPTYSVLGIYNPILLAMKSLPVRLA
ncbi:MAG: cytochrome P450 [Acidimicrobiales bacterium]|nr:cytochrome P450 [Acidimicrobiales bacterium]